MAAAMELSCWGEGWGLPSVHTESLVVLAYAKFSGAKLTIQPVDWTWKTLTGTVPALHCEGHTVTEPAQILNFLRKQRYNADYELSAKQGADTLAYIALLEEKLRPALLHTFWVDTENYTNLTRPWFASRCPFPLNFFIPGRQARVALSLILLTKGESPLHSITEVEAKVYNEAKECLNLLSHRLGTSPYFFGKMPGSLDAFVFGYIAPLLKASLPSGPLKQHLNQLTNLCQFCDAVLKTYFDDDAPGSPPVSQDASVDANLQKLTQLVNKESNLIEKMDDNLRSSPQHKPRAPPARPTTLSSQKNSTPA
ncbi:metaxin-3 isoform X1 [Paramormyrops kingsleyae]|uniref:Metaxin n=1 Tax=Paramormyrops kingsleyae TaxID=1676925 RepID=A0A3B3T3Y0_9TELE|nr:metaxin-3 isoform X1 [Paramormyrops kingsleyae]